jgi:5-methylcytosine-specific restriction endonuclease McrA
MRPLRHYLLHLHEKLTGKIPMDAPMRSPKWEGVRDRHLKKSPLCLVCDGFEDLNVHHIVAYHNAPSLELVDSNLATLCRKHHWDFGHFENWKNSNPNVIRDAAAWNKKLRAGRKRFKQK